MEQSLVNQENNAEQSPFFGNNRLFSGTTCGAPHLRIWSLVLVMKDAVIDGIAEKSLDFYKDGEFAYEQGSKTAKQRKVKAQVKQFLVKMDVESEHQKSEACQAIQALLEGLASTDRLRKENRQLRQRVQLFESERGNYEALALTQYKEEMYERVKNERDQELVDRVASQNRIIQTCFAEMEEQSRQLHAARSRVDRKEYEAIRDKYIALQQTSVKKSQSKENQKKQARLQKAKEELQKAEEDLGSSDEEDADGSP